MDSLEHEKKLLDLLSLKIVQTEEPNILAIVNRNGKQVGEIKRKRIHGRKLKKGALGYETKLETNKVSYSFTRILEDGYKDEFLKKDKSSFYSFDVKNKNQNRHHVEIDLGINPSLTIWSEEYGFINFLVSERKMRFTFESTTERFHTQEHIEIVMNDEELTHLAKQYYYQLDFCSIDNNLENREKKTSYILSVNMKQEQEISLCESTWRKGKLVKNVFTEGDGKISDIIVKHKDGIEAFKRFRYLINEIIPFKKEVIKVMLEQRGIAEYPFSLFIDDIKIGKEKTKILK